MQGNSLDPTTIFFGIAALVLLAKVGGLLARRLGHPAVLGELLVGIGAANLVPGAFGRAGVDFVRTDPTLRLLGEIGVLILMFDVGLEADLRALRRVGRAATLVAVLGVVAPFALGWFTAASLLPQAAPLAHVFLGASLTATSVGITARVLKDLGAMRTAAGQTILGAALLDDVFGLVILAVVAGLAANGGGPADGTWTVAPWIFAKASLLLVAAAAGGHFLSARIARFVGRMREPGLFLPVGLAFCFLGAGLAQWLGLAGILGAFATGLLLDPYGEEVAAPGDEHSLAELLRPLGSVFVPLFFVLAGLHVDLTTLGNGDSLLLGLALFAIAVVGKLVAGLAATGPAEQRWVVAFGMVPRGEVGLIFAAMGTTTRIGGEPLFPPEVYSALVLMVVATTLLAPLVLGRLVPRLPDRAV